MSQWTTARYEIQARRREEIRLRALTKANEALARSVDALCREVISQGLGEVAGPELRAIQKQLAQARSTQDSDEAHEILVDLEGEVLRTREFALRAKQELEERREQARRREEEAKRAARTEFERFLSALTTGMDDITRDFALDELDLVRRQTTSDIKPGELAGLKEEIRRRVAEASERKAREWREKKKKHSEADAQRARIDVEKQRIETTLAGQGVAEDLLNGLDEIRAALDRKAITPDQAAAQADSVRARAEQAIVGEECRREAVTAIVKELERLGFVVDSPKRRRDGGKDDVVVMARRPTGQQALFQVSHDGGFQYKFEGYDGMSCRKDMDKILPKLDEVYGIKLSDARVLWQNPDKISKDQRPLEGGEASGGER